MNNFFTAVPVKQIWIKTMFQLQGKLLKVKESFQTEIATCFVINNAIIEDEIPQNVKQTIIKRP